MESSPQTQTALAYREYVREMHEILIPRVGDALRARAERIRRAHALGYITAQECADKLAYTYLGSA